MKKISMLLMLMSAFAQAEQLLNRGNEAEPSTLDPQLAQGNAEMDILRDLFVGLIDESPDASLIPGVAESWTVSEDGKIYTFKIRENAKWSDGSDLTASDFVYSWQRAVNPATGSKYSFFLYPIANAKEISEGKALPETLGVEALDNKTLKVTLQNATPYFLGMLVNSVTYPVPKQSIEKHQQNWTRPENMVSNGPFTLKNWIPQSHLNLEKSPQYYGKDEVKLDKVVYHVIEDRTAELKRYRAGELDLTSGVSNDQIKWLQENLPEELKTYNYLGTYYYGFNLTKPPFKDNPKLREALYLAVDREKIVKFITASGEKPAYNFVVPEISNYQAYIPKHSELTQEQRNELARKLYREAGYSKDKPAKFEILYNTSENNKKITSAVAAMWKEVLGVQIEQVNKEWKAYLNDRRNYNTEVFRSSWIGDYDDPNTFLEIFTKGGGSNTVGLDDSEYDELIAKAAAEGDLDKRAKILQKAEQRLLDQYALVPIHFFISKHMIKPYVKGYQLNVMNHLPSKYIYIDKK